MTDTPGEIARADQHFAEVAHDLDQIVAQYRLVVADCAVDRTITLDVALEMLSEPKNRDGSAVSHDVHVGTLANLLAVAIDRLASTGGGQ